MSAWLITPGTDDAIYAGISFFSLFDRLSSTLGQFLLSFKARLWPINYLLTKVSSLGPLDLCFWSFLIFFLHLGTEKAKRHLPWNCKKNNGKVGQMYPRSCSLFSIQSCTQIAVSESWIALARFNLTFQPLGVSPCNLAHLFIIHEATQACLRVF